jgi:hypothetical protein
MSDILMQNIRALIKEASEGTQGPAQPQLHHAQNAATAAAQQAINASALQSGNTIEGQTIESLQRGLATQSAEVVPTDRVAELQKAAALNELVESGMDFYSAFGQVADADLELQKEAAFNELTEEGYSFDDAVALIQASL